MKTKEQIEEKIASLIQQAKEADKQAHEAYKNVEKAAHELHQQEAFGLRLQAFILSWVLKE